MVQQIRIASYNVENLFSRPRAMNQPEVIAAAVLRAHARVNELFASARAYAKRRRATRSAVLVGTYAPCLERPTRTRR